MENISNTDFDRLETLLRSKQFDELTPNEKQWVLRLISQEQYSQMSALYQSINISTQHDIEPHQTTKSKLDKALAISKQSPKIYRRASILQSAAAAILFFFIGLGINRSKPVQTKVVHNTKQVVKYVDRPVKQILYVYVPVKNEKKKVSTFQAAKAVCTVEAIENPHLKIYESNPEILRQQEIAMANINRVLNEKNGSSMSGDTVLQKMMVTVY